MYARYLARLNKECLNIWQNGRQLCESISLTGHSCVYELHRVSAATPSTSSTKDTAASLDHEIEQASENNDTDVQTAAEKSEPNEQFDEKTINKQQQRSGGGGCGGGGGGGRRRDQRASRHANQQSTLLVRPKDQQRTASLDSTKQSGEGSEDDGGGTVSNRSRSISAALPTKPHTSSIVTRAASNCGEFQRERKDPFELIDANSTFYNDFASMEFISKKILIKHEFAVFKQPSFDTKNEEVKTGSVSSSKVNSLAGSLNAMNLSQEQKKSTNESEQIVKHNFSNIETSMSPHQASISNNNQAVSVSAASQQVSETCTSGMIHSESLPGVLPLFSSWSLLSIGKYSDYNPHTGKNEMILFKRLNRFFFQISIWTLRSISAGIHDKLQFPGALGHSCDQNQRFVATRQEGLAKDNRSER
jgi:hypothetical protein